MARYVRAMSIRHARVSPFTAICASWDDRRGFSLPELVIALMLLTIGLLALASTSAFLVHQHAASGRAEHAATLAASRLEMLRAGGCTPAEGTETNDGLTSAWSVTLSGALALATVRVSWLERGEPVAHRYESGFPC